MSTDQPYTIERLQADVEQAKSGNAFVLLVASEGQQLLDAIASLRAERDALRAAIDSHNEGCQEACEARGKRDPICAAYRNRRRSCPDCPTDWTVDVVLQETGK